MDQAGTTCLDGAQTSAPATAAGTGSGGMTNEQMMRLMTMLQQNQQTGQAFRSVNDQTPLGQVVALTEQGITDRITQLENEIIVLRNKKKLQKSQAEHLRIDSEIATKENDIRNLKAQRERIRKEASLLGQAKDMAVGACLQQFDACLKGGFNAIKGLVSVLGNLGGGDENDTSDITID